MNSLPSRLLFVHVEEPSMEEFLIRLLPRLLEGREVIWKIINHGSKQALLSSLPKRLAGYARWSNSEIRVLVLVDRDADDCRWLKARLEDMAAHAGLSSKSRPDELGRFSVVNRVVIEELEAWFFGDMPALSAAFPGVPVTLAAKAGFRDPDAILGGTWEALHRVLQQAGHFVGTANLPKIEVARRMAPHISPPRNSSQSFKAFIAGVDALIPLNASREGLT